jgi:hypothetical protein
MLHHELIAYGMRQDQRGLAEIIARIGVDRPVSLRLYGYGSQVKEDNG